jgi:hypothetical protein
VFIGVGMANMQIFLLKIKSAYTNMAEVVGKMGLHTAIK